MRPRTGGDRRRAGGAPREDGYALIAAVTAVAAFAYVAFQVMASGQGGTSVVSSRIEQAKLAAAADAGIALAIHGLAVEDPDARWRIDGRQRSEAFDGVKLAIVVEDERGKVPLNRINDIEAHALFTGAGADSERADALTAEYRAWEGRNTANGQSEPPPTAADQPIRRGPFATVGELMALKDMDAALLRRIAPVATVFFGESGPFLPEEARPLAVVAMNAHSGDDSGAVSYADAVAPPAPDEDIAGADDHLYGRPVTVSVTAQARDGARTHRMAIVELTGDPDRPYWVRYAE
jgi:general secretion pathway protein K